MNPTVVKRCWRSIKLVLGALFILQLVYLVVLRWIDPPFTLTQVYDSRQGYTLSQQHVTLDNMSAAVKLAAIAAEDHQFLRHWGFNLKYIKRTLAENKTRQKQQGASTISQQVAKNVFLWQDGGWFRKGLEVYFTFMIELLWSKQRILEVYLNVAEMGPGIYGIEAAAQVFFRKPAVNLSVAESALIIAGLPNPKQFSVEPMPTHIARRYPMLIEKMVSLHSREDIQQFIHR